MKAEEGRVYEGRDEKGRACKGGGVEKRSVNSGE